MSNYIPVSLVNILGGAAVERFDTALGEVIANILDYNTEAKKAREIIVKVKIQPMDDERRAVEYDIDVKTKLASPRKLKSIMYVGQKDGELVAMAEDVKQGKLPFDSDDKVIDINTKEGLK